MRPDKLLSVSDRLMSVNFSQLCDVGLPNFYCGLVTFKRVNLKDAEVAKGLTIFDSELHRNILVSLCRSFNFCLNDTKVIVAGCCATA